MNQQRWFHIFAMLFVLFVVTGCNNEGETKEEIKNEAKGATESLDSTESLESVESVWPRTIENGDGTIVTLEKKPEKIAVLHFGYTEYLFALGVSPIATTDKEWGGAFETLQLFKAQYDQLTDLGETMNPNIEKLVEIQPDLIIAGSYHEDVLENVRKIAPVIIDQRGYDAAMSWQETITYYGNILGEEQKAADYIAETEQVIQETGTALSKFSDKTFVFLRPSSKANFGVAGKASFSYYHEGGFGLNTPEGYPDEWQDISLEGLVSWNPDFIFFQDNQEAIDKAIQEVGDQNVWKDLAAVKNGDVYNLDISVNTGSPLAIKLAAETIKKSLGEE